MSCTSRPGRAHRRARGLLARAGALGGGLLLAGVVFATSASAHVKVSGIDAVQGGSGVVTFRVPSESTTASTTELLITFPSATPSTSVDTQPKLGWTATVTKKPLAHPVKSEDGGEISEYVSQVDFKATTKASAIPPGQFDLFNLSVGPFPDAPSVSFDALQTYSDGSTVNWDEQSANGVEPPHPAPVLDLAPAATGASSAQAGTAGSGPSASSASSGSSGSSGTSWTGVAGLVIAIVALAVSIVVLVTVRSGRKGPRPA